MLYLPNFATVFFSVCVCVCGTNHDFTLSDYLHKAVKHTSDFTSHTPCRLCGFILSLYVLKKKPNKTPPNNNKKTTNKKTQNKNQKTTSHHAVKISYLCWFSLPCGSSKVWWWWKEGCFRITVRIRFFQYCLSLFFVIRS